MAFHSVAYYCAGNDLRANGLVLFLRFVDLDATHSTIGRT